MGFALAAIHGIGCVPDEASAELATTAQPIQGGQLDTGYPAVGEITLSDNSTCTGTLVAPSYVLSAKHCANTGMVFFTGTDLGDFVSHPVDVQIMHPTLDLMIAHLVSPVVGIAPLQVTAGATPAVGSVCIAVGFGRHDEGGLETVDIKRSATEQVTSANAQQIVVSKLSGIADRGDSGGPLLCGGRIAAVVHNHDETTPDHTVETYTTADAAWIASQTSETYTDLALQNGWTSAVVTRTAGASLVAGVVRLKGAITGGTSAAAFTLPSVYRPVSNVYVAVDLCGASHGRLAIDPSGAVTVQGAFASAQCMTSLEGVSFVPVVTGIGLSNLALQNGWTGAPFGTGYPQAELIGGIAHLKGAISTTGSNPVAFTLPAKLRPATDVYVPVDMCGASKGRLYIQPSGVVTVQAEVEFASAACFTSLDGASFAPGATGFTALALQNGWTSAPYSTSAAAAQDISGIAHLRGAIATTGTNPTAFTLPSGLRPASRLSLPVDLCSAANGHLVIETTGVVTVEAAAGAFDRAQCFTSLDGVSFAIADFTALALANGWTNAPYATSNAAVALVNGIVHLRGAIAGGSDPLAFTLPTAYRPTNDVYVSVDLCSLAKGQLYIQPSGAVHIQAEGGALGGAQCFTSLDGVSFARSTAGFTPVTLQNGWTNAPSARGAAAASIGGTIRLAGTVATTGTSSLIGTLPSGFAPPVTVFVPVTLCNATKGRLVISSDGVLSVAAEGPFSSAQCFTSLEGVSFAQSTGAFVALALKTGWTNAPFDTRSAVAINASRIVRFAGAIATGGTTGAAFTLPIGLRPAADVYLPIDLCGGAKGRLWIQSSGLVTVQDEASSFANAQCFSSLEGAWFAL